MVSFLFPYRAVSHGVTYGFTMEFFAPIDKADCAFNVKGRHPIVTLSKTDKEAEYWPRITKDKIKNSRIVVDWNKWIDEDEVDEAPEMGGDMDPSAMSQFGGGAGGMPGMGGMGGMPGMGGMGGMPGMEGMGGMPGMGGMGGMPGMGGPGGMGGMDMEALMKQMGGMGGMGGPGGPGGMPDSDDEDEEEEAAGEPVAAADGLGDLDAEEEK